MKPVDMLVMQDPANGVIGDCFRCCIASILEMPAADVPHFGRDGAVNDTVWFKYTNDFLRPLGLCYVSLTIAEDIHGTWFDHLRPYGVEIFHVLAGMGGRGVTHATVGLNGKMVHDPHPSRSGLVGPDPDGRYEYGFIIKTGASANA